MKRKAQISKLFFCTFAILTISLLSANFIIAQCGNYFKPNYTAINKLVVPLSSDVVLSDWIGDGKADLTIYRDGDWWMLRSSNNAVVSFRWGTANDFPVPVYRNSISADLTLYNPTNNTWN